MVVQKPLKGQRPIENKLATVISGRFPLQGGEYEGALAPFSAATSGALALALAPVAEEEPSRETVEGIGSDWPSRPSGVSDSDLYQAWLLLKTPWATVSGKKNKDGVVIRTPYSYSRTVQPRAISTSDERVSYPDAYVITRSDMLSRLNKSARTRFRKGMNPYVASNIVNLENKKATQFYQEVHAHRVSVWSGFLTELVDIHRLKPTDMGYKEVLFDTVSNINAMKFSTSGIETSTPINDASVNVVKQFVGPVVPVVSERNETWRSEVRTRFYYWKKKRDQLKALFNNPFNYPDKNEYFPLSEEEQSLVLKAEAARHNESYRRVTKAFETGANELTGAGVKSFLKGNPNRHYVSDEVRGKWKNSLVTYFSLARKSPEVLANLGDDFIRSYRRLLTAWNQEQGRKVSALQYRMVMFKSKLSGLEARKPRQEPLTMVERVLAVWNLADKVKDRKAVKAKAVKAKAVKAKAAEVVSEEVIVPTNAWVLPETMTAKDRNTVYQTFFDGLVHRYTKVKETAQSFLQVGKTLFTQTDAGIWVPAGKLVT